MQQQLLASTLDRAANSGEMAGIIGTIAGDDTVFSGFQICHGRKPVSQAVKRLLKRIQIRRRKGKKIMALWGGRFETQINDAVFRSLS